MSDLHSLRLAVGSALVVAARKWRRTVDGALTAYNISEACASPLLITARIGEGIHQVALAEQAGIEGPSLVRLLDQLCAAGLVRRKEDLDDRRAKTIWLTEEGRALTTEIEENLLDLRERMLKGASREDLEATMRVLNAVNAPDLSVGAGPQATGKS
ncbi:MarR family transcriptional regulator [Paraburkholderia sp.]|uniref:MarR family winged helix-turn-helix transcriptional regulator n=1 Tax=Paraburkholderia sp. TaxID=1926495 RepID=UPI00238D9E60|nr:MarR family transcriptional regulator [Paraburkholderia sp.]MDE1180028.1 MarR family transcriptional regulator [Paraburkholderia sp.]